ncbi:Gfo/Idh/MocA family protein [Paenibacillus koleovorans]|uniref:Gfo/Idh/MocA family protein n=1 Tax=Paenibacillus koleovorans TaxID=121608 RepID=UPI000FD70521|nr:Gfo/Idh/MocA family oxidoreductase [Paenibacillus koleovorans]
MKIAIIGCGTMGKLYAERFASMQDAQLTALANRSEGPLLELAEQYGATPYRSWEELFEKAEADVVCVTLPTHLHKEVVLLAAAHGKHIICEKPLALNPDDAEEMRLACERAGVRLFAAHVLRYFPEYAQLKAQTAAGVAGRIGVAHAKRASKHPVSGSWYADVTRSGGIVFDLMIHDLDFLAWTLGEVRTVYAAERKSEGVIYASVTLRFASGAIANVEAHWGYPGPFLTQVELAGTGGVLRFDSQTSRSLVIQQADPEGTATRGVGFPLRPALKDPFSIQLEQFLACIRSGDEPLVTAQDGVTAVRIAYAAAQSLETGLPVRLSSASTGQSVSQEVRR